METTSAIAAPVAGQFRQRFERKFFIIPRNLSFAYAMMRQVCRPDSLYPFGQINSLYFDTADLDQYERSASGEFEKDKVRIRWYGEGGTRHGETEVFLELKSRRGFASSKRREKFMVPAESLDPKRLSSGIIDRRSLNDVITEFGHFPPKPLRPVITVSYRRYRFTEIASGVRVSLDYNVRSTFVAREFGYGERELPVEGAVIEVKGPNMDLPRTLRRMKLLNTDWSRFSKYSACIDAHITAPGTVARLWPSGRVVVED